MLASSILVSIITLFLNILGFLNQMVLAKLFGASSLMDSYLIASNLPIFISGILMAAQSYALIPALISHKKNKKIHKDYLGMFLIFFLFLCFGISILGYFLSPLQISFFRGALNQDLIAGATVMARISWITAGLMILSSFFKAIHQAENQFIISILPSILPFVIMIMSGIFFGEKFGPFAITLGMLVGFIAVNVFFLVSTYKFFNISLDCIKQSKEILNYFLKSPLVLLAMLSFTIYQAIDSYWAPKIGIGNLSYLSYSQKLIIAFANLVISGPSIVIFRRLSLYHIQGKSVDFLKDIVRALKITTAFSLPLTFFVGTLGEPIIKLLFENGVFTNTDSIIVSSMLPEMMLGSVAMISVVMIFRALFAQNRVAECAVIGIFLGAIYFLLSGVLIQFFQVRGISLSYMFSMWATYILGATFLFKGSLLKMKVDSNFLYSIATSCLIILILSLIGLYFINIYDDGKLLILIKLFLVSCFSLYFFIKVNTEWFKIKDMALIYNFIHNFFIQIRLKYKK